MNDNVLHRIRNGMDGFSKGQKRIANYILTDCDKASNMTACRLGQITQVSESTVVRFASQLGYDGYPAMQKALQELVRGKLTSLQRIEASGDQINSGDIAGSVMQQDMDTLRSTIDGIDRTEFDRVVGKLVRAKRIYILGVRSSSFLAGYLNFYFHLIFENVTLVQSAAGEIFDQMLRIGPGDVLLAIGFPRYSKLTMSAVHFARDRGAEVIAITDSKMSPLYTLSVASLLVHCEMISFVDSMAPPVSLLNALIVAVGKQKSAETAETFAEMERVWSRYEIFGYEDDE